MTLQYIAMYGLSDSGNKSIKYSTLWGSLTSGIEILKTKAKEN